MSGTIGDNLFRASGVVASSGSAYDDDVVQSNIALLGFYIAVNGSLVRYNLVDQSIDEYFDTSGVDASASTNDDRSDASPYYYQGKSGATVTQNADSEATDGSDEVLKWTGVTTSGSFVVDQDLDIEYLVVAGGATGAVNSNGGGGGAGGYLSNYGGVVLGLTADTTYTITVGAGGAAMTGSPSAVGNNGNNSSVTGSDITDVISIGGGGGGNTNPSVGSGGSGGGAYYNSGTAGTGTAGPPRQGYDGGTGPSGAPEHGAHGGGGASEVGNLGGPTAGGAGGDGVANAITGSSVTYAGGGGGSTNANTSAAGAGGAGGGTAGTGSPGNSGSSNAAANTGGGSGGSYNSDNVGAGGSGIVIIRYTPSVTIEDMTLQSTDVSAESEPDYGELVMLMENAYGTATLNTDIKGYVSRDSGTTFTQGTIVNEGSWGTNKQILAFHDLDISGQPSGTSMCYKLTTHNQVATSKETRIYATSIGWR